MTRAFTLLELLIVLATVAVLIALSAGTLSGSLRRANEARCLAYLRQQLVGLAMMRSQQNDLLPIIAVAFDESGRPRSLWREFQNDWCAAVGQGPMRAVEGVFDSFGRQVWRVGPPWKCPDDRPGTRDPQRDPAYALAEVRQSSYFYWPASFAFGPLVRRAEHRAVQRFLTQHWESDPRFALIRDEEFFHRENTKRFANEGFLDGSAGRGRLRPEEGRDWRVRLMDAAKISFPDRRTPRP